MSDTNKESQKYMEQKYAQAIIDGWKVVDVLINHELFGYNSEYDMLIDMFNSKYISPRINDMSLQETMDDFLKYKRCMLINEPSFININNVYYARFHFEYEGNYDK